MRFASVLLACALVACQDKSPPPPRPDLPPDVEDTTASLDTLKGGVTVPEQPTSVRLAEPITPQIMSLASTRIVYLRTLAPDTLLWLKSQVYVSNFKTADRIAYSFYKDNALLARHILSSKRDSLQAAGPAYDSTSVYKGCAQVWLNGDSTKATPATAPCWSWSYKRPSAPPATLDSIKRVAIRVLPLVPGGPWARRSTDGVLEAATDSNQARVCAFFVMLDGSKKKAINSDNIQKCDEEFQRFLAERST